MDDAAAVERVRSGDLDAFATLVDRHLRSVRTSLALRAPAPHLADELAHDAFVQAYRSLDRFTGGDFGGWVRAIAFNLLRAAMLRHARDAKNRAALAREPALRPPSDGSDPLAERLRSCLERMPPHLRELIDLRYRSALDGEALAARLGRSLSWVHTTLFRARERLRVCIEAGEAP